MTDDDRLADLLLAWEEMQEQGRDVSAEDLCRVCPDLAGPLAERIAALKRLTWAIRPARADAVDPPHHPGPAMDGEVLPRTLAGRYCLENIIGECGFGRVWRAFDLELQRPVAVKVPKPGRLPAPADAEGLLAEARKVARLRHPGIVPVYDIGHDGDRCFI